MDLSRSGELPKSVKTTTIHDPMRIQTGFQRFIEIGQIPFFQGMKQ